MINNCIPTLKQEVPGSNPGAAPPMFGAHTPPYYPPPGRKDVPRVPDKGMVHAKAEHPGFQKNNYAKKYARTSRRICHFFPPFFRISMRETLNH